MPGINMTEEDLRHSDQGAKDAVARKEVIAVFLQECDSRYSGMTIKDIIPLIESVDKNRPLEIRTEYPASLRNSINMDTLFLVKTPNGEPPGYIYVNIDIQKTEYLTYRICNRQQAYDCVLLYHQLSAYGDRIDYNRLAMIYSIWIILEPKADVRNTYHVYRSGPDMTVSTGGEPEWVSLCNVVSIRLGSPLTEAKSRSLDLMNLIFSKGMPESRRQDSIERRFGFKIDLSVLKEVKERMGMTEEYGEYKYELGACYKMGVGTPIDLEKAVV